MIKFKWETEFKQTEIGEVPREWEVRKVGDIIKIKYGKGLPSKNRKEGNVPVFGSSGVVGYHNSFVAKGPGLIIGRKGNIGSVYLSKTNFFPIDTVFYAEEVNDAHFMYYLLSQVNLQQLMSDSAVPGLNINFLKNVFIPYPPSHEQSHIATVLSWFDDLIENKKRQNEILEKVAMAIFKSWFVDFEPFEDDEFVYSEELGKEIPKGWEVKPIGEVARIFDGIGYSSDSLTDSEDEQGFLFVTLNNVLEGGGFKPDFKYLRPPSKYKNKTIRELDIVLANKEQTKKGILLGSPALVFYPPDYQKEYALISCNNTAIIPIQEELRYLLYLKIKFNQPEIAQNYHGGTSIWYLHQKQFAEQYFMLIPPQPILQHFHSLVEPLFQKIILNQKQIMVLRKIRDALLPKLVFGKLRVEEI